MKGFWTCGPFKEAEERLERMAFRVEQMNHLMAQMWFGVLVLVKKQNGNMLFSWLSLIHLQVKVHILKVKKSLLQKRQVVLQISSALALNLVV